MTKLARASGVMLAVIVCAAVIAASQVPWTPEPSGQAMVRLSWRAVPPSVEDCHAPTEDELAGLPAHMRPRELCSGRALPFRLRFVLDGRVVVDEQVVGAGARRDRPVYVFHELRTDPGSHRIEVEFGPEQTGGGDGLVDATSDSAGSESAAGTVLVENVELGPLDIALVTRRSDGTLVLR